MAVNYYEGWTEAELLALRRTVQEALAPGRPTEVRLAGESVRTDAGDAAAPELTLERIAYALYCLYLTGETDTEYPNPRAYQAGVTRQLYY